MKPGQFRFALALVVLLHHSTPLRLGNWAVFVFFILSGYWIARLWEEKYSQMENSRWVFLLSRWWRLFPVFFTCSLLSVAMVRLLPGTNALEGDLVSWLLHQLPIAGSSSAFRALGPTWSLDVEMQFYVLAAVSLSFLRMVPTIVSCVLTLGAVGLGFVFVAMGGSLLEPALPLWLGFFQCGVLVHQTRFNPRLWLVKGSLVAMGALLAGAVVMPGLRSCIWMSGQDLSRAFAGEVAAGASITFVNALLMVPFVAYNVRQPSSRLDRRLGDWAYPLYLFHWIPRTLYYQAGVSVMPIGERLAWLLADFAAAMLGSWLILLAIDRPSEKIRARWIARCEKNNLRSLLAPELAPLPLPSKAGVLSK